jgi:beta/gamma crystallin
MRMIDLTKASSRRRLILMTCLVAFASMFVTGIVAAQRGDPQRAVPLRGDPRAMSAVGITVFVDANFGGPNANFRDDVPDIRKYNLNDRVDSLQIPRGEIWEVCVDINYKAGCQVFSADETDLARIGWGGRISSLRRVADARRGGGFGDGRGGGFSDGRGGGFSDGRGGFQQFPPVRGRLVLFDDFWFSGRSFIVTNMTPSLRALGNRARSAKVYGGAWELCDGDRFQGRCEIITDSMPDLGRLGLRDRVSSVRPVRGGR